MKPIDFEGTNTVYHKPDNMTDDECRPLPVMKHDDHMTSCWVPTDEERSSIANGANIALTVWGEGHPPVAVYVPDNWMVEPKIESKIERVKELVGIVANTPCECNIDCNCKYCTAMISLKNLTEDM